MSLLPASTPISLLIPCRSSDAGLCDRIESWRSFPGIGETIVCCDAEPEILQINHGEVKVVAHRKPSRGGQLNRGASEASGSVFLFHHLDSDLRAEHTAALFEAMKDSDITGGAFYRKFDERHPGLIWLEKVERFHCRNWGTLYGDQSLFVRRPVFEALGGFPDFPLMEDVAFSRKLRSIGGTRLLDPPMSSSPRRHLQNGPWKTTLKNALLLALYHVGVSPNKLSTWYYPKLYTPQDAITFPSKSSPLS